jgi:hypothetical protein
MRTFIKGCGALFVVAGLATIVVTSVISLGFMYSTYGLVAEIALLIGGAVSGASLALVGGGTYVFCSIDERLEMAIKSRTTEKPREAAPDGRQGDQFVNPMRL